MTCTIREHTWQPTPRASSPSIMLPGELLPAVCTACGTRYPCRHQCGHLDCAIERGDAELPLGITAVPEESAASIPTATPPLSDDPPVDA